MTNLYEILQCSIDSTDEEIRKKYQQLILEYHPDKCTDENKINMFIEIDKAWKVLRDKDSRERYNAQLKMDDILLEKPLLYGTFHIDELIKDDETYYCECRCGGNYTISESDLKDFDDTCFVQCELCSLTICVKIKEG